MTDELNPQAETILRQEAARVGVSIDDLIIRTFAPRKQSPQPTISSEDKERVIALLQQWNNDIPAVAPPAPNDGTMTPSEALFRQWELEDAALTDEQREEQEKLWQDYN